MQSDLVIRKGDPNDIDTIRFLAENSWPATYKDLLSPEQIDYMMDLFYSVASLDKQMQKDTFLIAEINNEPVGFASYSETEVPGIYKLHKLYVKTTIQGSGIGRTFIDLIVEELKTLNGKVLELNVKHDNNAQFFYKKLGFEIIREIDIDIGNNYWMRDYVMQLNLADQ